MGKDDWAQKLCDGSSDLWLLPGTDSSMPQFLLAMTIVIVRIAAFIIVMGSVTHNGKVNNGDDDYALENAYDDSLKFSALPWIDDIVEDYDDGNTYVTDDRLENVDLRGTVKALYARTKEDDGWQIPGIIVFFVFVLFWLLPDLASGVRLCLDQERRFLLCGSLRIVTAAVAAAANMMFIMKTTRNGHDVILNSVATLLIMDLDEKVFQAVEAIKADDGQQGQADTSNRTTPGALPMV